MLTTLPFWPECLHIQFPKINLCKAIFYIFEIRFRKMKICNVIFYLRQINSPEFKYVISWVVPKAMCLQRCFSRKVSSSDACIAPRILDFSQSLAFCGAKFPTFLRQLHQESLIFHRSFRTKKPRLSLFWCNISYIFPWFWPHCTKNLGFFTEFSLFGCNISCIFP